MQLAVPKALGTMTWLGRGPHENYWDGATGAAVSRYSITVNLDDRQTGVGGDDGWGARPHDEYTLHAKPCAYRFRLRGYTPSAGSLADVARRPASAHSSARSTTRSTTRSDWRAS